MKRRIAICALALVVAVSMIAPASVFAAKGPHTGKTSFAFINLETGTNSSVVYSYVKGPKVLKDKRIKYSKKTNTLTLTNYSNKKAFLVINEMGDDFKIKVVGKNHLATVLVWGYGYGAGVKFTGKGKIYLNEKKNLAYAVEVESEHSIGKITVDKTVKMKAYAGTKSSYVFSVVDSKSKTPIVLPSKKATKNIKKVKKAVYKTYEGYVLLDNTLFECTAKDVEKYPATYAFQANNEDGEFVYEIFKLSDKGLKKPFATKLTSANKDEFNIDYNEDDETAQAERVDVYQKYPWKTWGTVYSKKGTSTKYVVNEYEEYSNSGSEHFYVIFKQVKVSGYKNPMLITYKDHIKKIPTGFSKVKTGAYLYNGKLKQKSFIYNF